MRDDFRGLAEVASVEFTLDALFGLGVKGEIHGASISFGAGAGGRTTGRSVVAPAAALRPAAAWSPFIVVRLR